MSAVTRAVAELMAGSPAPAANTTSPRAAIVVGCVLTVLGTLLAVDFKGFLSGITEGRKGPSPFRVVGVCFLAGALAFLISGISREF